MKNLPQRVRSKKLSSRVDLTAMVSVSFLLIIFFMLVGELSKAKVMDLSMPERHCDEEFDGVITCGVNPQRIITVLLDDNNKIITYSGLLFSPLGEPKKVSYGNNGIRKVLLEKSNTIREYLAATGKQKYGPIVIIKPSKKCNFKNLVDILDEMAIAKIETYAIVNEYSSEESKLLASN
ncbi:Biopolymer transport protein ExbD [Flavobacterium sp. CF108]|jgi:biopolymer transport protein ExbD|uniref:ExbD/TolR family protein n=1 Tax=unclassified Flavobacterium TaxID=196869 RepID=UPI0008D71915|nr:MULTISPECIES: biopolymer transporter ExbD [unclassified Flavobacterium]SEO29390.1 Biopolymer transport protein ExbD [Flavobacterium sp. fv08]SHG43407.1 Biopolymer transport protein ExbD [Flavobacterium sp. CF108]